MKPIVSLLKLVLLVAFLMLLWACGHKDPTLDAAPPPGANAQPLPNMAGNKPMMGAAGGPGAQAGMSRSALKK